MKIAQFARIICTYNPELRGLTVGSNNGNYKEYSEFKISHDGKYYVKYTDSSNGDLTPYPGWEEVTAGEFLEAYERAVIEREQDR